MGVQYSKLRGYRDYSRIDSCSFERHVSKARQEEDRQNEEERQKMAGFYRAEPALDLCEKCGRRPSTMIYNGVWICTQCWTKIRKRKYGE